MSIYKGQPTSDVLGQLTQLPPETVLKKTAIETLVSQLIFYVSHNIFILHILLLCPRLVSSSVVVGTADQLFSPFCPVHYVVLARPSNHHVSPSHILLLYVCPPSSLSWYFRTEHCFQCVPLLSSLPNEKWRRFSFYSIFL